MLTQPHARHRAQMQEHQRARIELGDIPVDVEFKKIKNLHLSVHPPSGRVRISAPDWMDLDAIRVYAISKLDWIKKQQKKLQAQERETPREYIERESHYLWGRRYLLRVIEREAAPSIELAHHEILLSVRPGTGQARRQAIFDEWYRRQVRAAAPPLIAQWEQRMGVKVARLYVQRMKTRWGSCTPAKASIRLNSELAKKPRACLEYVIVHELAHLLEPSHNARFKELLDRFLPHWKTLRDELNQAPLGHVEWGY